MDKLLGLVAGWKGCAAIALACFLIGAGTTWRVMSWKEGAQKAQVLTKTITLIKYRDRISTRVETQYIHIHDADVHHTQTLIEDIPAHVTPQVVADFPLPCAFGRVFNDAWHGPIPDTASCPDGAASDTPLDTVAKAEATNGGNYDAVSHQLEQLQDWIRQQQAANK